MSLLGSMLVMAEKTTLILYLMNFGRGNTKTIVHNKRYK